MFRSLWRALGVAALAAFLLLAPAVRGSDDDKKDTKKAGKPTIPVFRLRGEMREGPGEEEFPLFGGGKRMSFRELVSRLKKASEDPAVKAVVLLGEGEQLGAAQVEELRQALAKIRGAGKDVYVHSDSFSMREFLLFAGATRISAVPTADLWITGIYGELPYLRGLLDKIGVKPEFLTCGAYKSAAEMFMRTGPSPEADQMQNWLLDSLYGSFVKLIAEGRKVDEAKAKSWIDNGPYTAEKAKEAGIIDAVEERQDFTAMLKTKYGNEVVFSHKYGAKKEPEIDLSSPFAVLKFWGDLLNEAQKGKKGGKAAIGIVYVEGPITLGAGESSPFESAAIARSSDIRKALDQAARDDSIKAVVLRVDSPGGSAVASDIILDATKRVKAKKPFVVSMGNVAGSGGYYVSCAADTVFADDTTITGSIGVVGGKIVTTPMWNKIGITFKDYKRGKNAGILNTSEPWTAEERQRMQGWMNDIYVVFKKHVTDIRGSKLKKPIDELAGGRVYTGQQALELGLVDKIGSLQDAIAFVADKASVKDYDIRVVPEPKNFLEKILEEASGGKDDPKRIDVSTGPQQSLVELAMPYLKGLDPQRVRLIGRSLYQLQTLQQEGAVLMMPEMRIGN
jgi:protease-4